MWTQRTVTAWLILTAAAPSYAPDAAKDAAPDAETPDPLDNIIDSVNTFIGNFNNFITLPSDKTDSNSIKVFYNKPLEALQEVIWDSCFPILRNGKSFKLWDIHLSFSQKAITMTVDDKDISFADPGYIYATVKFNFPDNMILTSKFKFKKKGGLRPGMLRGKKFGELEVRVGPASVTVKPKMPTTKSAIKSVPNKKVCQYYVPPDGVVVEVSDNFEIRRLDFDLKNHNELYTTPATDKTMGLKAAIFTYVKLQLGSYVLDEVKRVVFSCLEEDTAKQWALPVTCNAEVPAPAQ